MRPDYTAPVPTPIRWWRLRPWSRNHLMRRSDRYEAALVLVTAILVLLPIPVAAAVGTATHTRLEQQTDTLRASVRQVPAVLLEDTHPAPDTSAGALRPAAAQDTARAQWSTPEGPMARATPATTTTRRTSSTRTGIFTSRRPPTPAAEAVVVVVVVVVFAAIAVGADTARNSATTRPAVCQRSPTAFTAIGPSQRSGRPIALTVARTPRPDGRRPYKECLGRPSGAGDVYRPTDTHDPVCLITCPG
jgi:hypothetical protein